MDAVAEELIEKIKVAARCEVVRVPEPKASAAKGRKASSTFGVPNKIVAIGISTGGPQALAIHAVATAGGLSGNHPDRPAHAGRLHRRCLPRRLDETCALEVKEATSGDMLLAWTSTDLPWQSHMKVKRMPLGDVVILADGESVNGHRPSVDVLFHSVAHANSVKTQSA